MANLKAENAVDLFTGSTVPTPATSDNSTKISNTAFVNNLLNSGVVPQLLALVTKDPTGFPNRTDSIKSFNDGTRTFSISPASGSFTIYFKGKQIDISTTKTLVIPNTEGFYSIYFDNTGTLQYITGFDISMITDVVYVANVHWDVDNQEHVLLGDERHGLLDNQAHLYLHQRFRAGYLSGFSLLNFSVDGDGSSNSHAQFTAENGEFLDEDIHFSHSSTSQIPIFYRLGSGVWRRKAADAYPLVYSGNRDFTSASGRICFNLLSSGTWTLQEVSANNKFILIHYFAVNDTDQKVAGFLGFNEYTTIEAARFGAHSEIEALAGLPFEEYVPIGSVIFKTSATYTNTPKAIVVSTDRNQSYEDFRKASSFYLDPRYEQALAYTPENVVNKVTDFTTTNNTTYPTTQAVYTLMTNLQQGFQFKPTTTVTTTAALPANTYNNGSSGIGATLSATSVGILTVDGYQVLLNDLVLVRNEANATHNGLYVCTTQGTAGVAYVLTRSTGMDQSTDFAGAFIPVGNAGTTYANSIWLCNEGTFTVGTTNVNFVQLNPPTSLVQGNNVVISGNNISVDTSTITDDTTTNATMYPVWVNGTTGQLSTKVSSSKLQFNPNTGLLSATGFAGSGAGLTGTASSLTAGTVTTNANLLGDVTSVGNTTTIANLAVTNAKIANATIDLTAKVTGLLPVPNGGTGVNTLTGVVIGNGTSAFTAKTNPSGAFVGDTDTQNLSNKSLLDTSTLIANTTTNSKQVGWNISGAAASTKTTLTFVQTANHAITFPDATDTLVGKATTDNLTNKTLTSAKLATALLDTNGANLLTTSAVASAVNYFDLVNAVTTAKPTLTATGSDANVTMNLASKGTGTIQANGIDILNFDSANWSVTGSSTAITTTSTSAVGAMTAVATGMTRTPTAGTYLVLFNSMISNANANQTTSVGLYAGGTAITNSVRDVSNGGVLIGNHIPIMTSGIATVNGSQAIELRWRVSGNTGSMYGRNLVVIKIG